MCPSLTLIESLFMWEVEFCIFLGVFSLADAVIIAASFGNLFAPTRADALFQNVE